MAFPETPARKLLPGGAAMARTVSDAGLGFDLDGAGRFLSALWELVKEQTAELWAFFPGLLSALAKKVDELFPPETRSETLGQWLRVAVTVVLPAALGALALLCLARCCWHCCWRCCCCCARGLLCLAQRCWRCCCCCARGLLCLARRCWRCCCCCARGRGRGGRTMVAPGRSGAHMPRGAFEANTRSYFRDLRAGKPLVY